MTTSFPSGLDALTNPTGSSSLTSPDHAGQHTDANDAIESLQAKVGIDGSAVTSSLDYKITNINASNLTTGTVPSARVAGSYTGVTSVGTLGSLNVSGVSSFGSEIVATTVISSGRGVGIKADPADEKSILQFTNNAISHQWSSLVATNNLLTVTTPLTVDSTVTTPALTVNGVATSQSFTQGTDYLSPYQGFRNKVINGNMSIWQRGTSVGINTLGYTADRWFHQSYNSATISRQPTSDTSVLPNVQYCARVQRNNGVAATNFMYFTQSMETQESIKVSGKTITLSFYARKGANFSATSNAFVAQLYSGTGTDQNLILGYTGAIQLSSNSFPLTSSWVRYSVTVTIPVTSTEITPLFGYTPTGTAGANDYFEITGVQLEEGSVATPLEQRPVQQELTLCERYYETSFRNGQTIGHNSGNFTMYPSDSLGCGGNSYFNHFYRTRKRSTNPTLRIFDPVAAHPVNENWWRFINACNSGNAVGPNAGVNLYADDVCFSGYLQSSATGIAPVFDWTIEAEL